MSLGPNKIKKLYNYVFDKKPILYGFRGSIAHNLHIPREADDVFGVDDIDMFGLYCFPLEYYLSLEGYYHHKEVVDEKIGADDTVEYELHKAFHLLSGCNPNIISFLFNKEEHYTHISDAGRLLLDNRTIFFSRKRIRDGFAGYAYSQLNRLTEHAYKGYMGDKRKNVVDEYGYNTKNAATLIRLLRQGVEVLETGQIQTFREKDRQELLDIKTGKLTLVGVQDLAEIEFKKLDAAFEKSSLPMENSNARINELLVEMMKMELQETVKPSSEDVLLNPPITRKQ